MGEIGNARRKSRADQDQAGAEARAMMRMWWPERPRTPAKAKRDGASIFPHFDIGVPMPETPVLAAPAVCLTTDEQNLVARLDDWWNAFLALPPGAEPLCAHHDRQEAQRAVRGLQRLVMARLARRQHPGLLG